MTFREVFLPLFALAMAIVIPCGILITLGVLLTSGSCQ